MTSLNILDPIWDAYLTTLDCLKVASRSVEKGDLYLISKTNFVSSAVDSAKLKIKESRISADDLVIVSLWAIFERKLVEYLHAEGKKLIQRIPSNFNKQVHKKIENEMEYWRTDDILDLFKSVVSSDLIGNAKQVKKYRDWVAHKNPKKGSPTNVMPTMAYKILSEILLELEQSPDLKQEKTTA